ncbi:hypothetical protein GCM10027589_25450 [Actinocorallia lasiicapitis]
MVRRVKHGDRLVRRVGQGVRRAVGAHAAQDVRASEEIAALLGSAVSSCRQIVVSSIRGGAGKTTVAALVARTLAAHRNDRVLALDADPSLGSLLLRLGARTPRSVRDVTGLRSWDDAQALLANPSPKLWTLPATSASGLDPELPPETFRTAQGELSRYFAATVIDCGPGLTSPLHETILSSAHAQILVAPATVDGALSTRRALDHLARSPLAALLHRTVVALVSHIPHTDADHTKAEQLLSQGGLPVIALPYDRHLATGTTIDQSLISTTTAAAARNLTTASFTRSR